MVGLPSFPHPVAWKVGRVLSEMAEVPDSKCVVWGQHSRPDAMDVRLDSCVQVTQSKAITTFQVPDI